jgi:Flp pilus assembly protein TadD
MVTGDMQNSARFRNSARVKPAPVIALAGLALGLVLTVSGCSSTTSTSRAKLLDGPSHQPEVAKTTALEGSARLTVAHSFQDAGDYGSALRLYQQELTEHPKSVEALVGMGELYAALHAYEPARQSFDAALAIAPQKDSVLSGRALIGKGQLLLAQNQAADAAQMFKKAAAASPENPRVYNSLGLAYDLMGQHEEAQVQYGNGLDRAPHDGALINNLALSFVLSKNYETAIRLLSNLVTAERSPAASRQNLALAYALSGDAASAENLLKLEMTPDQIKGRMFYFRRLQAVSAEDQTKALFLGIEPAAKLPEKTSNGPDQQSLEQPDQDQQSPEQQTKAETADQSATVETPAVATPEPKPEQDPAPKPEPLPALAAEQPKVVPPVATAVVAEAKSKPVASSSSVAKPELRKMEPAKATPPQSKAAKAVVAPTAAATKRYSVQLGAYKSENYALAGWRKMVKDHPEALKGYSPALLQASLGNKGDYVRLYLKEITERKAAENLCISLQGQKVECLVRQFPSFETKAAPEAVATPEK